MYNSFLNSRCISEGTCRLIPEYYLNAYTASSHVHFLNLFFLFCISSVTLTDTFCGVTMLCFFDYITALSIRASLKSNKNRNGPWLSWDFYASTCGCAGPHSTLWLRNRIRTSKLEIVHGKNMKNRYLFLSSFCFPYRNAKCMKKWQVQHMWKSFKATFKLLGQKMSTMGGK